MMPGELTEKILQEELAETLQHGGYMPNQVINPSDIIFIRADLFFHDTYYIQSATFEYHGKVYEWTPFGFKEE